MPQIYFYLVLSILGSFETHTKGENEWDCNIFYWRGKDRNWERERGREISTHINFKVRLFPKDEQWRKISVAPVVVVVTVALQCRKIGLKCWPWRNGGKWIIIVAFSQELVKTSSSSSSVWHREDVESAASLKSAFVRFCVHHKKDICCLCLSFGVSFRSSVTTFGEASPLWQKYLAIFEG